MWDLADQVSLGPSHSDLCSTVLLDSRVFQLSCQAFDFVLPVHQVLDQSKTHPRVLKRINCVFFYSLRLLLVPGIEDRQEGDSETPTQHIITSSETHTMD